VARPALNQRRAVLLGVESRRWWLDRGFLRTPVARLCTVLLLLFKGGATLTLAQQGLCAKFSTTDPMSGEIQTIPMNEPTGVLRSWDVRADWRSGHPACTAVVDRAYRTESEFPAWFLNIVEALHPQRATISMEVTGFVTVHESGVLP
jgi:hypothetical protein